MPIPVVDALPDLGIESDLSMKLTNQNKQFSK